MTTRWLTEAERSGKKRPTLDEIRKWPPTIDVGTAAAAFGVSRSTAYEAIRTATFPAKVIEVSRRKLVITATVIAVLEGDGDALAS